MEEAEAKEIAFRLEKYVKGGFAGLLNAQTNYDIKSQLTVFSIKQLEDSLRPIAMHVILDFIWSRVRTKLKKRLLIVDEAWYMMKYPDSASFLQGIAKRARKYYLGMTTLTQDIEDFLHNDYGKAIVSNSSIQILLKQGTAEVEALAQAFMLSEGEKQFLLTAQVGEGLLFAGQNHISAQFIASQFEYDLITSKPQDILDQQTAENALDMPSVPTPTPEPQVPLSPTPEQPNMNPAPIPSAGVEMPLPQPTPQSSVSNGSTPLSFNTAPQPPMPVTPPPVLTTPVQNHTQQITPIMPGENSAATNHTENMVRSALPSASNFPKPTPPPTPHQPASHAGTPGASGPLNHGK
jgi:hypothetical protein